MLWKCLFTVALRGLKRVKYNQNAVHDVCRWENLTQIMSRVAECVPDDQLQDTNSQALANSYSISHMNCTLPGDENKRKNRELQWKHSMHIRTCVAVSEVLIRLRNLLLPRHQFTHIEQKPASVCQRMTKLATECACMEFHLTGRDQLCSEWHSWCKCVTWMGL